MTMSTTRSPIMFCTFVLFYPDVVLSAAGHTTPRRRLQANLVAVLSELGLLWDKKRTGAYHRHQPS